MDEVICIGISRSLLKGGSNAGGIPVGENVQPTITANGCGAVCYESTQDIMEVYAVENHPNDSRATIDPHGIVQCLSSRMGTGGNNTPFVLIKNPDADMIPVCVIASTSAHAETTDGTVSPTLLCRAGTGGNQLPIVTLERK